MVVAIRATWRFRSSAAELNDVRGGCNRDEDTEDGTRSLVQRDRHRGHPRRGRQERVTRRDVPAAHPKGREGPERVRDDGGRVPSVPSRDQARSQSRRHSRGLEYSRPRRSSRAGPQGQAGDPRGQAPGRARAHDHRGVRSTRRQERGAGRRRRSKQRDGRGSARRELRRPAGDVSQRPRSSRADRELQAMLRVAIHGPRDLVPCRQGLRSLEGRTLHRHPAHGALGPRRCGRDVHDRHRDRASETRCSSTRRTASARTSSKAR